MISLRADQKFQYSLEKIRAKYNLPALGAAATVNGKIVTAGVTGVRKIDTDIKATVDDKFHLGSCTKSMTAYIAGILVDQKKINWESTLYETFPEYRKIIHNDLRNVTLKQLLSHTAGIPTLPTQHKNIWMELYINRLEKSPKKQREKMISKVLPLTPVHKPGNKFLYSNCGVSIAGMMLEKAANLSWEELLYKYIAKPLNIKSLGFNDAANFAKVDQPFPHIPKDESYIYMDPRLHPDNPAAIAPAGTAHLSLVDFAKYTTLFSSSLSGLSVNFSSS